MKLTDKEINDIAKRNVYAMYDDGTGCTNVSPHELDSWIKCLTSAIKEAQNYHVTGITNV